MMDQEFQVAYWASLVIQEQVEVHDGILAGWRKYAWTLEWKNAPTN